MSPILRAVTAAACAFVLTTHEARAQVAWKPERPVELIVTCQPGCGPDVAARTLQKIWQDYRLLPAPAVVVNKAGGGGAVANSYIQQKPGDAHALVLSGAGAVVNTIIGRGVGHRDLTALAMMSAEYVGIAVRADSSVKTGRELIDLMRKDMNAVAFGIANSLGNANHQAIALALKASGLPPAKARTVVFQSGGNAITALLGGHVQVVPASIGLWVNPLKAGQVRVVAVTSPKRLSGEFASIPTWRDQGVDAVVSVWRMIMAPPGLSVAQVAFWHDVLRKTVDTPEWKRELAATFQSDEYLTGNELQVAMEALYQQLKGLLTDLDLARPDEARKKP